MLKRHVFLLRQPNHPARGHPAIHRHSILSRFSEATTVVHCSPPFTPRTVPTLPFLCPLSTVSSHNCCTSLGALMVQKSHPDPLRQPHCHRHHQQRLLAFTRYQEILPTSDHTLIPAPLNNPHISLLFHGPLLNFLQ